MQDFFGKQGGCGISGSVLIDIKVIVEMGNPAPVDLVNLVDLKLWPEIFLVKVSGQFFQA